MNRVFAGPPYHHGNWARADIPHRNWKFLRVEDLGKRDLKCEMCEHTLIRFAHHMRHPDYADLLRVGCVCAGHMEGDQDRANRRLRDAQNLARRRDKWIARPWKKNKNGNLYLVTSGYLITVFEYSRGDWGTHIRNLKAPRRGGFLGSFPTEDAAKLAAFDKIQSLKGKSGSGNDRS